MTHQELRTTSIRAAAVLCAAIVCVFGSEPAFGHNNGAYNYNERSGSISHTSDNAYLHTWMTDLPDTLRLSDLSIPGTHDTMARRNVVLHAKTQSWTLNYQLHAGIRVLDIRCRRVKAIEFDDDGMPGIASIFRIYHGITDQDAQFGKDVLGPCIEFLDDHPGETILMRVMRSEQGSYPWDDRDTPFTETLDEYMDGYGRDYFWSGPGLSTMHSANPELGDIRKKIVILQDFDDYEGSGTHGDYGISFPNGLEFTDESVTLNEQSDLYRQWQMIRDFYNDIEDDAPSADPNDREDDPIYFNALTGSGVGAVFYTIPPSFVASGHFPLPGTGKARLTTGYLDPPYARWPKFPRLSCVDLGLGKVCTIYYEGMNILFSKRLKSLLNAYEDDPSITHRVGIISMDFPGLTLIKRIVALNGVPPNNAPPVAILTPLVYQGNEGSYITFSAAFSIDPNGDDLEFRWDFDGDLDWDTEWSESPTISHAYPDDWVGSMVVEVRDSWDASSTATGYVTVHNAPPVLDVRSNANADEGAMVTLGSTEFTDLGILDTHAATVDWGDGTGLQNGVVAGSGSSKTISGSHVYADNGIYVVDVCVTDDDGGSACDSFQVTVVNVPPTVSAGPDVQINESDSVSLPPSVFNDLGTLDTHTAVIHWGDGTPSESGAVAESPFGPPGSTSGASGSVSGTHQYGDDGVYTVSVDVTDDDGGIGAGSFRVTVLNVDPTVSLDTSTETGFCGGGAFTGRIGVEQSHDASADDIGSDDLQFVWTAIDEVFHADFEIGNRTYFNNGISPDPYPSPQGVLPYHADNEVVVIFSMPGVYTILVTVIDDDGGTVEDSLPKLVAGDDPCTRRLGLWAQQFSLHGEHQMTDDTLIAYLAYIDFASAFFSEVVSATTIEEARAFLAPRNSSTNRGNKGEKGANGSAANMKDKAAQELLAAWLNVASGSVGLQEMLSNRMTILQTLCHVELVLMDPTSEHHDYLDARAHLRLITNIGCRF